MEPAGAGRTYLGEFQDTLQNTQKALRRTGALTVQETINHLEIINLVQQGVKMAMTEQNSPTSTSHTTISEKTA